MSEKESGLPGEWGACEALSLPALHWGCSGEQGAELSAAHSQQRAIPGNIQGQVTGGSDQPDLVEDVTACGRQVGLCDL